MRFGGTIMAACAGLLFGALPAAGQTSEHERQLHEAARKEGEVTWYVAHHTAEHAEAAARAFSEKFPGIKVNPIRNTAQVAYQRLAQDTRVGAAQCDVFTSTDIGHFVTLKAEGALTPYKAQNAGSVIEAFRGIDPDGHYYATNVGLVLITYRTDKVAAADAPKKWTDLLDPKWKGQISTGHPGFSGYVGTWVVLMKKMYGWDYFKQLEKNQPRIGRSINDTVTMLNAGEATVAAGTAPTTLTSAARGNPLGLIYPEDGTLLMITSSAIPKNAPHPNAAKLFLEFLLSADHSRLGVAYFQDSMHASVPGAPGTKPLDQVKTVRPTTEEIEKGVPEVKELWRDTFGS